MAAFLTILDSALVPHARGEILVKLAPEAQRFIALRFSSFLRAGAALPRGLGIAGLDALLNEIGVRQMAALHPDVSATAERPEIIALRQALSATYRVRLPSEAHSVATAVLAFRALRGVIQEVSPNPLRVTQDTPNDPELPRQWGIDAIGCRASWDRQTGDPSVVIGVIDSGVEVAHPDLIGALMPGRSFVDMAGTPAPDGWRWEGTLSPGFPPADEVGHGTHVTGIMVARTGNGFGIAGVARPCRALPVRVLARMVRLSDGAVKGSGTAADVAAGIRWAVDQHVAVLNMSFGFPEITFAERDAIDYALAHNCVPIAAMGDQGPAAEPMFPALLHGVVAVGAVDSRLQRAPFSQTGAHIALTAPGVQILSTVPGGGFQLQDGTSMATAFVSGVVALLRSANPHMSPLQVAAALRESATRVPGQSLPNEDFGSGVVNADAALQLVMR